MTTLREFDLCACATQLLFVFSWYSSLSGFLVRGGVPHSRVNLDLAPYFLYHGFDARPTGLNLVGLRRGGFTAEQISALKHVYQTLFSAHLPLAQALARIEAEAANPHVRHLAEFIRASRRGIARP